MTGNRHVFNFHDGDDILTEIPELLWLGRRLNHPEWASLYFSGGQIKRVPGHPRQMIWYKPVEEVPRKSLPLDACFPNVEVASFRSDWNDPNALYAATSWWV